MLERMNFFPNSRSKYRSGERTSLILILKAPSPLLPNPDLNSTNLGWLHYQIPNLILDPVKNLHGRSPKACSHHTIKHGHQRHTQHPPAQPAVGVLNSEERTSFLAQVCEAFAWDKAIRAIVAHTEKSRLHATVGFGEEEGNGYSGDLIGNEDFDIDAAVGAAPEVL